MNRSENFAYVAIMISVIAFLCTPDMRPWRGERLVVFLFRLVFPLKVKRKHGGFVTLMPGKKSPDVPGGMNGATLLKDSSGEVRFLVDDQGVLITRPGQVTVSEDPETGETVVTRNF